LGEENSEGAEIAYLVGIEKLLISKTKVRLSRHNPRHQSETTGAPYKSFHQGMRNTHH
jgi:hypothetical protein